MRESFPTPPELKGALQGTLLYLALYFVVFIQFQSYSKFYLVMQKKKEAKKKEGTGKNVSFREVKYYNSKDLLALTGDRAVGNFVEYAIVFLPLMWLHALFVNPDKSFTICALYTFFRSYYPVAFMMMKTFRYSLFFSTVPGYVILFWLFVELSFKAAFV